MKHTILLVVLACTLQVPTAAQGPKLERTILANRKPMTLESGKLSGPGADFLRAEARSADFFLVGESHGNRETPALVTALATDVLGKVGFDVFAIETGPITAGHLASLLRSRKDLDALEQFHKTHPYSVPFFNWRADAQMLAEVLRSGYRAWGLDQEFIGSGLFLLEQLVARTTDAEARSVAERFRAKAEAARKRAQKSGSTGQAFLMTATRDEFAALRKAFAKAGAEERRIVEELAESAAVYQLFRAGKNYESNRRRIRLMKRHLADQLAAYRKERGRDAKVLLRFGSMHMARGHSLLNQLDLGNQAAELGFARGRESFHLVVLARRIVRRSGGSVDVVKQAPYMRPFLDAMTDAPWTVFDLRPLRPYFHVTKNRKGSEMLAKAVFGYDAVALTAEFRPAVEMVPIK